jgi:hypothetical protein
MMVSAEIRRDNVLRRGAERWAATDSEAMTANPVRACQPGPQTEVVLSAMAMPSSSAVWNR